MVCFCILCSPATGRAIYNDRALPQYAVSSVRLSHALLLTQE